MSNNFRDELIDAGLLLPSGADGVYGRGGDFEPVIEHFERFVTERGRDEEAELMRFPPVIPRAHYERTDHIRSFPDLLGSVSTFTGNERDHLKLLAKVEQGESWNEHLAPADLMLIPAACYPLYPLCTGTLPEGGRRVDLRTFVFRREPSLDPARMQCFRQREYVRVGPPEEAMTYRNK